MLVRPPTILLKLLGVVIFVTITTSSSFAKNVLVDCSGATPGTFVSINAALFSLPLQGPNLITIAGTCTESVTILGFHELTLQGSGTATIEPSVPNTHTLTIFRSQGIFVKGPLVFDGGDVNIYQDSVVNFEGVTVQNSFSSGIFSSESIVDLVNSTIQNSAGPGISVEGGSVTLSGGVMITKNSGNGILARHAGLTLIAKGSPPVTNVVSNNPANGIVVTEASRAYIDGDNRIDNNGTGLFVGEASTTTMVGGGEIMNNTGPGVHITKTSHGEFAALKVNGNGSPVFAGAGAMEVIRHSDMTLDGDVQITGNRSNGVVVDESSVFTCTAGNPITNNSGNGILVEDLAIAHFFGNDTISGNGKFSVECDNTSLVEGDVSNFTHVKCSRISSQ